MTETETKTAPNVLLVEDNPINQKLMVLMLGKLGIQPVVADDGRNAVAAVQKQSFSLILMDLHMPGMDGMEATAKIRDLLGEQAPPIVALTADAMQSRMDDALSNGLDGYLTKPVNADMLKECIARHTGKSL